MVRLGLRCVKAARGTKATGSANGIGELVYSHEPRVLNALNHHLCNSIAALEVNGIFLVGVQERDCDFAAVTRVHSARSVDHREAMLGGQSGAGMDQGHKSVGERYGDTGWNKFPFAGGKVHILAGTEIGTRIAGVRVGRGFQPGVEHFQLHLQSGGAVRCRGFAVIRDCGGCLCTEYCGLVAHSGSFYWDLPVQGRGRFGAKPVADAR